MMEGITETALVQKIDRDYKVAVLKEWDGLRETQREMFRMVATLYGLHEAADPDDLQYWVSRYDIADALGKGRLNDAEIQRLTDLVIDGFLQSKQRSNGHIDQNGRWRPHNSSHVYRPILDVQLILAEAAQRQIAAKSVTKPQQAQKHFKPHHQKELYEHFEMPAPVIRPVTEYRLSVYDHISVFGEELGAAFKILLTNRFFLAGVALVVIVITILLLIGR